MFFSDIHIHLLYGADDGPQTREEMFAMVDKLYNDGTRLVCATPHCYPEWCGDNRGAVNTAFAELGQYCAEKYPDMKVMLGSELYYEGDGTLWIKNGFCNTMNGTRYVLVEFQFTESDENIFKAVREILHLGYVPIIAHAERYSKLRMASIREFRESGVLVQVNARKDFGGFDFFEKQRLKTLLRKRLVDIVSTDAHDLAERSPCMREFYDIAVQKYGEEYADAIFRLNAEKILCKTEDEQ